MSSKLERAAGALRGWVLSASTMALVACGGGADGALAAAPADTDDTAIVNGQPAGPGEHVAVGALIRVVPEQAGDFYCSGTLIAPDVVLTAAHCLDWTHIEAHHFTLARDVTPIRDVPRLPPLTAPVRRAVAHPDYLRHTRDVCAMPQEEAEEVACGKAHACEALAQLELLTCLQESAAEDCEAEVQEQLLECLTVTLSDAERQLLQLEGMHRWDDVALVFLAEPLPAAPLPLARAPGALQRGTAVQLVGYGARDADAREQSGVIHHGPSAVTEVSDFEVQLSADEASTQACWGDSGGPALVTVDGQAQVAAVASRNATLDGACRGLIYTRVDRYVGWIDAQLQAACLEGLRSCAAP